MKILVSRIPKKGIKQLLNESEGWVRELVLQSTQSRYQSGDPITGNLSISETLNNVTVKGEIHFSMVATCDRCLKEYPFPIDCVFDRLLTPLFESKRQKAIEESLNVEVTEEDLGFSYYEGEEIDISAILNEQIILSQPMRYLCREDCKGLCPHCAINRNEKACKCEDTLIEENPFSILKQVRWKSKK